MALIILQKDYTSSKVKHVEGWHILPCKTAYIILKVEEYFLN